MFFIRAETTDKIISFPNQFIIQVIYQAQSLQKVLIQSSSTHPHADGKWGEVFLVYKFLEFHSKTVLQWDFFCYLL